MVEWIDYGVALGWLIDPFERRVYIYRPDADPVVLDDPETISGDPELPGFGFNVRDRVFDLQSPLTRPGPNPKRPGKSRGALSFLFLGPDLPQRQHPLQGHQRLLLHLVGHGDAVDHLTGHQALQRP